MKSKQLIKRVKINTTTEGIWQIIGILLKKIGNNSGLNQTFLKQASTVGLQVLEPPLHFINNLFLFFQHL